MAATAGVGAAAAAAAMVKMEPTEVKFLPSSTSGGFAFSHHKLINVSKEKVALKVKCSDNRVYRLRPVYSLLEPGRELTLTIARLPVPDKKDKLVIQIITVRPEQTDAQVAWRGHTTPPDANVTLVLGAAPATPAAGDPK